MREIKFRAWYREEKFMGAVVKIEYPSSFKPEGMIHIVDITKAYIGVAGHYFLPYSSVELMQYTGLKDKNGKGKEAYEGDIVKSGSRVGVIKYGEFEDMDGEYYPIMYGFHVEYSTKACSDDTCQKHILQALYSGEVIGNIYDNPELLES